MAADENFLSRWSRRKTQARTSPEEREPEPAEPSAPVAVGAPAAAAGAPAASGHVPDEPAPLPAVETLTPESDYSPFMGKEVDGELRNKALKSLFADPRFNVMDMMDVYVDDYSKPDPLPESWLAKMDQSWLGDKGGRDREEAERRKALAEAPQEPAPGLDAAPDDAQAMAEPGTDGDAGGGRGVVAEVPGPEGLEAAIPPRKPGESGA